MRCVCPFLLQIHVIIINEVFGRPVIDVNVSRSSQWRESPKYRAAL